jgi:hypothetical protein
VLEKPRRASFSFDKVEQTTTHIVGRKDDSFAARPVSRPTSRPAVSSNTASPSRPRNTAPQHGGKQFPARTGYQ